MWSSISDKVKSFLFTELYPAKVELTVLIFVLTSLAFGIVFNNRSVKLSMPKPTHRTSVILADTDSLTARPKPDVKIKSNLSVNINTATQAELEALPGIGPKIAERIIAYRERRGGFRSIDELLNVKGIGPKKFERIKPFIKL